MSGKEVVKSVSLNTPLGMTIRKMIEKHDDINSEIQPGKNSLENQMLKRWTRRKKAFTNSRRKTW
jgi:hypothetical protein